eukprot:5967729-Prorocentrum_lima.AAC.1
MNVNVPDDKGEAEAKDPKAPTHEEGGKTEGHEPDDANACGTAEPEGEEEEEQQQQQRQQD